MTWDGEKIGRIKSLIGEDLSATDIGRVFGVSRHAIIGICYRRGIPLADVVRKRARVSMPSKTLKEGAKAPTPVVYTPPPEAPTPLTGEDGQPFTLLTAKSGMCRFMPEDGALTICGHASGIGSSWCAYHLTIVYVVGAAERANARSAAKAIAADLARRAGRLA